MTRLAPLLGFDAAAAAVVAAGATLGVRAHRAISRAGGDDGEGAPAAYGLRIAGAMIAAFGLAGMLFVTTYRLSVQ